ncbi:hypothetical protein MIMGU_mgv1a007120mg [Erythranthe guttata]|uniref:Endonuclease/exonuclease/phosphatase domain-containing protein n=1 Tax=Erythranthe guttata TaxID=4155 RepID=A0A022QGC9_ERYGU|nr:hypothetical protein MIMGU_mgv1a007120mg [Erythranthe guttata]
MHKRMKALGDLIELHSPDVICFQEVTPSFYEIFRKSNWWKGYRCSISNGKAFPAAYFCMQLCKLPVKSYSSKPFHNSIMARELCIAEVELQPNTALVVATSHLESPCPSPPSWDQMFSKERIFQANEAVKFLDKNQNVIFCGDMNWDDKLDGPFPKPEGWLDAWTELRPGEIGYTYDTKSNTMLSGNRALQKRLDRFICKLKDFKISRIEMIGRDAIPGVSYTKEKKLCKLPVKSYSCKPFHNSIMGRELCIAEVQMQQPNTALVIATSHLESPCPRPPEWDQMYSNERVFQAKEAVKFLDNNSRNVIFCGDMNWNDELDGPFPKPEGWLDAWTELRPGEIGYTYDTKSNTMLTGKRAIQERLDRFLCKLKDFKISGIELIGRDAIPGLFYTNNKNLVLPVFPSDHFGLLLTICPSQI